MPLVPKQRVFQIFHVNETLKNLVDALRERVAIIGDEESRRDSSRHMARLQEISERIEKIERGLPANLDPQLRHYLQRRSYSKALDHLTDSTASRVSS